MEASDIEDLGWHKAYCSDENTSAYSLHNGPVFYLMTICGFGEGSMKIERRQYGKGEVIFDGVGSVNAKRLKHNMELLGILTKQTT